MGLLQGSEVEINNQVSRKYYVPSDAEEHGASSWFEMRNPNLGAEPTLNHLSKLGDHLRVARDIHIEWSRPAHEKLVADFI